MITKTATIL